MAARLGRAGCPAPHGHHPAVRADVEGLLAHYILAKLSFTVECLVLLRIEG